METLEDRRLLATIIVDTPLDVSANDGLTSLREAVNLSNVFFGADEIRFDYTLEGETIQLNGTPLTVLDRLTIQGPGTDGIAISGNEASSVLVVEANRSLTIDNLTIRDAVNSGIINRGMLSVSDSLFTYNVGTAGGGISNSGSLTLTDSTVFFNAAFQGGGIHNTGTATIRNSKVQQNAAYAALPDQALGGGISVAAGTVSLINSSVSHNAIDDGFGTGIAVAESASLYVSGSTVSSNRFLGALGRYGGVATSGTTTLINSTVSGNGVGLYVSSSGSLTGRHVTITENGLGVWNEQGTVSLYNSIIAGNLLEDFKDSFSDPVIGVSNLVGNRGGSGGMIDGINGNWVGYDANLGPLQYNLGPTATHALLPGSLAIDHGDPVYSDSHDQRGRYRPQGASVDIGAFELYGPLHRSVSATAGNDVIEVDHAGHVTTITKNGVKTEYADVELLSIRIQGGDGADIVRVNSTPPIEVKVFGDEGDDKIYVGGGDYTANILGLVTIHGGDDQDELILDDSDAGRADRTPRAATHCSERTSLFV